MTSRKLSESDKQEMLQLYRQPGETTSTLASRYGVSNSTISRILKTSFSEAEYEALIQQKRGNRTAIEETLPSASDSQLVSDSQFDAEALREQPSPVEDFTPTATALIDGDEPSEATTPVGRRLRKRSSAARDSKQDDMFLTTETENAIDLTPATDLVEAVRSTTTPSNTDYGDQAITAAEAIFDEDLLEPDAVLPVDVDLEDDDDEDDDLDDLEDDDDEDELDDLDNGALFMAGRIAGKALVQVLPLTEASLPRTCYLVVDRSAELIAKPLKEFGDLGQIPEAEVLEKTLPVFDNHRVAKRYSNPRTQRVIKLPDGQVLQKTSSHLQAKGITRLLIDGRVYAL